MSNDVHVDADNLAGDLNVILSGFAEVPIQLLEKLVIYIANRDHKVFDHAYKLGKESNNVGSSDKGNTGKG